MQRERNLIECIERAAELVEDYNALRLRAIAAGKIERANDWAQHVARETAHIARLSGHLDAVRKEVSR